MKTITLILVLIFNSFLSYSQNVCATSFKRNNGNGTCSKEGQLRITFPGGCPAQVPLIDSIYAEGKKFDVVFAAPDTTACSGPNGYIGYCVLSGNIPPVQVLQIFFRTSSASFNCMVIENNVALLPIKLSFFDATVNGGAVSCKWMTEDEGMDHDYRLQRSFNGSEFSDIAVFMIPAHTVSERNTYTYTDKANVLRNKMLIYYRIKEIDNTGKVTYSKTITVQSGKDSYQNIASSPNPFNDEFTITLNAEENANAVVKIINVTGQVAAAKLFTVSKGVNSFAINKLGNLSPGIYVLQVAVNNIVISNTKLVKN